MKKSILINDKQFIECIDSTAIQNKIIELATQINKDFFGKKPAFVVALKGAIFFATDLLKSVNIPNTIEFISAKSYGSEMTSSGKVDLKNDETLSKNLKHKDVIIIEDIIDTGLTLKTLVQAIKNMSPASVNVVTLFLKHTTLSKITPINYYGFLAGNKFLVGYGMDYDEQGRNLTDVYELYENDV